MASARMIALLGLLAVAGYQNRDRLGDLLGRVTGQPAGDGAPQAGGTAGGLGDLPGSGGGIGGLLGGLFGGGAGSGVAGGLQDLIDRFTGNGHGDAARSWVETGPNRSLDAAQLEGALGEDTIAALTAQTGLSRSDLLTRLQAVLPTAVDTMTPAGRLPSAAEVAGWQA